MDHMLASQKIRAVTSLVTVMGLMMLCPAEAYAQAILALNPVGVYFGSQRVNIQSNPATFSVSNIGDDSATEISCTVIIKPPFDSPDDPLSFTISSCPTTLAVGASFEINVWFTPYKVGSIGAGLQIAYQDGTGERAEKVSLDGMGFDAPDLFVNGDWSELNTGNQHIAAGPTVPALVVPMENRHISSDLIITAFNQNEASCDQFIFNFPGTPFSLSAGAIDFFSAAFDPSVYGASSCDITFTSDDPDPPDTFTITGMGIDPTILATPSSYDFGVIGVDGGAYTHDFSITNDGTLGELIISSVSLSGGSECDAFALSGLPATPFDLTPGAQELFSTEFNPLAVGHYDCTIVILSNDPEANTTVVPLTGKKLSELIFTDGFEDEL